MPWYTHVHKHLDPKHFVPREPHPERCTGCGGPLTHNWQWFNADSTRIVLYCDHCWRTFARPAMHKAGGP